MNYLIILYRILTCFESRYTLYYVYYIRMKSSANDRWNSCHLIIVDKEKEDKSCRYRKKLLESILWESVWIDTKWTPRRIYYLNEKKKFYVN